MNARVPSESSPGLRLTILMIVVGCLFVALLARLWFLQVINASTGQQAVASTGIVTVYTPAPRGEILDRNGQVLVASIDVPVVEVEQEEATNHALVTRLAALLGMTTKALKAAIDNDQYSRYTPVPVYEGASPTQILYIQEHKAEFPNVTATTETQPYVTPLGEYAAAIVGYVGQPDAQRLAQLEKDYPRDHYQPGDAVGLTGVEAEFESVLRGKPGVEEIQTNPQGVPLGVIKETPPVPGDNIRLTINANVQEVADKAILEGQGVARATKSDTGSGNYTAPGGSAVVEDPQNGQILALATEPTFDPNLFDRGQISQAEYYQLSPCSNPANPLYKDQAACAAANPADPLSDRAIQGEYAPGSTFKLATATAGLRSGLITPTSLYNDTGSITIGGRVFHDDDGEGAGWIDVSQALTVSSDNFFNEIGAELWDGRATYGQTALQEVADEYGLGSPTGIDLPGESAGVIPTPALYAEQYKEDPKDYDSPDWFTGDSAITAIGQGEVLVTPLQLANAYAAFSNGGTVYQPQVALDAETPSGKVLETYQPTVLRHSPSLTDAERQAMVQGYLGVTHSTSGTAYPIFGSSNLSGEDIAGKTGTAQVEGKQDTSVFIGFAPATGTQYVVDCFMEDAGYGESVAAPVVREIFDELYGKPLTPVTYVTAEGNAT